LIDLDEFLISHRIKTLNLNRHKINVFDNISDSKGLVRKAFISVILLFNTFFSNIGKSDNTSGTSISSHSQRYSIDTEMLSLFKSHILFVISITIPINKATSRAPHCEISLKSGTTHVDRENLWSFVWIPTCNDVSSLKLFLVIHLLEHSCCSKYMW